MFFNNSNLSLIIGVSAAIAAATVYVVFGPHETKKRRKHDCCPGLINHGSTCFLNALLQSLAPCASFTQWLQEFVGKRHSSGSLLPLSSTVSTVLKVLNNVEILDDFEDVYSPRAVINALKAKRWIITPDEQDAHELFHVITETLDEEVRGHSTNGVSLFDMEGVESSVTCPGITRISSPLPQLSSRELSHPFRGLLVSQLQCQLCGYKCPMKYDTFDSLSVSIPSYHPQLGGLTLDMLLRKFVHSETVHNVTCDNCNRNVTGAGDVTTASPTKKSSFWKKLSLGKTPRCLCIHLQRTAWLDSGLPVKRNEHVTFPEVLDLTDYMYTTVKAKRRLSSVAEAGLVGGRPGDTPSRPSSVVKPYPAAINLLKARHYEHRLAPNGLRLPAASEGAMSPRTEALATIYSRDTPPGAPRGAYRLVSVIVHQGDVHSGHFVTYRLAPAADGQHFSSVWLYANDTAVRRASLTEVLDATAYMLFYEKI